MESFYRLSERMDEVAMRFNAVQTALEDAMEENGGELTEETGQMMAELDQLREIASQIEEDFVKFPDEYAAWYKNEEAKRNVIAAERKAVEEEMKKVLARYDARIKAKDSRLEWIKQNIALAMKVHKVETLDKKSRPNAMFSIYFKNSSSIEVNEEMALDAYREAQRKVNEDCPEWLEFVPKIKKGALSKVEDLPFGFERKYSKSLQIL